MKRIIVLAIVACAVVPLVAAATLGLGVLSACGGAKSAKKAEFSISPAGLNQVENAAPSKDYALYVAAASVPASAADLANCTIVQCIAGETAVNRAAAAMMGIVTGVGGSSGGSFNANVAAGDSTADGIKKALAGGSLVLVKRGSEVPSDAVEVVLK